MKHFFSLVASCQHTVSKTLSTVALNRFFTKRLLLLACFLGFAFSGYGQYRQEWVKEFALTPPPQHAKTDHHQNLMTLGDNQILKFDRDGNLLWQESFLGVNEQFVLDEGGNAYVLTSYSPGNNTVVSAQEQVLVTKFTPDGQKAWEYAFSQQDHKIWGNGIDVNHLGEVYITTTLIDTESSTFIQTQKLSAAGSAVWQSNYDGFGEMNPSAHVLKVNKEGDVFVAGVDRTSDMAFKPYLLKYSGANGVLLVEKNYVDEFTDYYPYRNELRQMYLDDNGDVYIAGHRYDLYHPAFSNFVLKTTGNGEFLWRSNVGMRRIELLGSTMDENGNTALLSYYQSDNGRTAYLVTKINSAGQANWSHTLGSSETVSLGAVQGVAPTVTIVDGKVAVAGRTAGDGGEEIFAVVFSAEGDVVWSDRYNHPATASEGSMAIAADASGSLYIVGYMERPEQERPETLLLKYTTDTAGEEPLDVKLYLPPYAMKIGEQVRTTADFGDYILYEDTGIRWTWGDNSTPSMSFTAFGTPRITGWHRYDEAGIYKVGLDFEESNLEPASEDYKQWMVIFDPKAGAVLGGGVMHSPRTDLDLMQDDMTAAFTFLLDYKQQQHDAKPSGALVLAFENKDIFWSTSEEWLVVKNDRAVWHGTGRLNGKGRYGYIASAADGGGSGLNDTGDHLRIQIWDMENGNRMVYDNSQLDTDIKDMSQALPPIYAGQIIIGNKNIPANLFAFNPKAVLTDMMQVEVFPTRFQDKATLNFTLVHGGAYTVAVHDLNGRVVQQVKQGHAVPLQQNTVTIDGAGMKAGIYIARVVSEEGAKTVRVVVTK